MTALCLMSANVHVSIHDLAAADLGATLYLHKDGGAGACIRDAAAQLHWPSLDALDAWVDRLGELAGEARRNATHEGVPDDPLDTEADVAKASSTSGSEHPELGGTNGEGTPAHVCDHCGKPVVVAVLGMHTDLEDCAGKWIHDDLMIGYLWFCGVDVHGNPLAATVDGSEYPTAVTA